MTYEEQIGNIDRWIKNYGLLESIRDRNWFDVSLAVDASSGTILLDIDSRLIYLRLLWSYNAGHRINHDYETPVVDMQTMYESLDDTNKFSLLFELADHFSFFPDIGEVFKSRHPKRADLITHSYTHHSIMFNGRITYMIHNGKITSTFGPKHEKTITGMVKSAPDLSIASLEDWGKNLMNNIVDFIVKDLHTAK